MPKRIVIAAVCLLAALAGIAIWLDRASPVAQSSTDKSAKTAIEISASPGAIYSAKFTDLQGKSQTLGQWERKLLVVNFWATWCGPCKEEIPILVKLHVKFGGSGVQIIGIAADSAANVANFNQNVKINYPLLIDEAGAIGFSKRLGNRLGLLPHSVVFLPGGEVIYNKLGAINELELATIIAKNLPNKR